MFTEWGFGFAISEPQYKTETCKEKATFRIIHAMHAPMCKHAHTHTHTHIPTYIQRVRLNSDLPKTSSIRGSFCGGSSGLGQTWFIDLDLS